MPQTDKAPDQSSRRDRRRTETVEDIKAAARAQIASGGPSEMSLRAIARELGMTASAVSYYFRGREALLDALVLDGYKSLGDALRTGLLRAAAAEPSQQWLAVCLAHRAWALKNSGQYLLLYGHDGSAAAKRRTPAIHQAIGDVVEVLFEIMRNAVARDQIDTERLAAPIPESLARQLGAWRRTKGTIDSLPTGAMAACMITYAQLHGAITLELVGHVRPALRDRAALFELEMAHAFNAIRRAV